MKRIAFYPGSFDPMTLGHLDMINKAARLCDHLVIGIGVNASKSPLFTFDERVAMINQVTAPLMAQAGVTLSVIAFSGLMIETARAQGARMIVRGVRDGTDLDFEMQMAGMNAALAADLTTVFLPASPGVRHITATLVRQIASMKGDLSPFVPAAVAAKLLSKFA